MPRPSLGFILPATTQGELPPDVGSTESTTGSAAELGELCRRAEATGADSLWAVDHLYWPHPIGEAFTTLAVAAATTTRPMLGHLHSAAAPCGRPPVVAKQATALQLLSGGRFVLGLGVGIHEPEYTRAGVDYHRSWPAHGRGRRRTAPGLGRPRSRGAPSTCRSRRLRAVPMWFGGSSAVARRRAAAVGDGWVPALPRPGRVQGRPGGPAARNGRGRPRSRGRAGRGRRLCVCRRRRPGARPGRPVALRALRVAAQGLPQSPGVGLAEKPVPPRLAVTQKPGPATSW